MMQPGDQRTDSGGLIIRLLLTIDFGSLITTIKTNDSLPLSQSSIK